MIDACPPLLSLSKIVLSLNEYRGSKKEQLALAFGFRAQLLFSSFSQQPPFGFAPPNLISDTTLLPLLLLLLPPLLLRGVTSRP